MLLTAVAMWGLVFIGVHELIVVMDAVQLVTIRFAIAGVAFALLLAVYPPLRPRLSGGQRWRFLLMAAFAVPGSQVAVVHGQRFLSPALAALVMSTSPAIAAVAASLLLAEPLTLRKSTGFAIALVGAATIIVFGAGTGADLTVTNPWAGAVVLVSAVSWAIYTVLSKPVATQHHPLGAVAVVISVGTLMLLPAAPHAAAVIGDITPTGWAWMVYLALGGTFLPYIVWMVSLRTLQASQTVAYMYLIPLFALLWSGLLLGEVPTLISLAGGVLVILGVALAQVPRSGQGAAPDAVPAEAGAPERAR